MRFLNLILLTLFSIGSFSAHSPKLQNTREFDENFFYAGKKWVVLVATSSGWNYYGHQADICHAYQIMKRNGIPKENIITMMVDDIAYNSRNPTPGKIINQPNGTNVYEGVIIDYKGNNVNKNNFINIITGNKTAMASIGTGKVVLGGPKDTIFINIVGSSSSGVIYFPYDYLYADQLNNTLYNMYKNKTYKKVLLYVEGSKSGSMFDGILGEDTNVLAVTASGPRENSYRYYCGSASGEYRTCLGDEFGVTWMENLDAKALEPSAKKRSIFNHFREVRTNVIDSNVMMYGDFEVGSEKLSTFIGYYKNNESKTIKSTSRIIEQKISQENENTIIYNKHLANNELTEQEKQELEMKLRINSEV